MTTIVVLLSPVYMERKGAYSHPPLGLRSLYTQSQEMYMHTTQRAFCTDKNRNSHSQYLVLFVVSCNDMKY